MRGCSSNAFAGYTAIALTGISSAAAAQDRFVEDIQISRSGASAQVIVQLACPMRFIADTVTQAGFLLEARIAPFDSCRTLGLGTGIAGETYRPVDGSLAHLEEVEYESLGYGDNLLFFRFDRPVTYRISQRPDLRQLELVIDLGAPAEEEPGTVTEMADLPAAPQPSVASPATRAAAAAAGAPPQTADYMINLQSSEDPIPDTLIDTVAVPAAKRLYVSETTLDGETWHRLRLGFFQTEDDARAALETLRSAFPRAWIGRADAEERRAASSATFEDGGVIDAGGPGAASPAVSATPRGVGRGRLDDRQIAALMAEAREALLADDFEKAIRNYTLLLGEYGEHQQEAREYLGVARERNGQRELATAEYRAYLAEYADAPDTARVRQRLDGLLTADRNPRASLRSARTPDGPSWDFAGGISQYYHRDVDSLGEPQEDIVTLSALRSDFDLSARRSGGRLDTLARISASHFYDLIGEENGGPGDQSRVSYAYLDMTDVRRDWALRLGRQSLHNWGVLGRFDGAHFTYGWNPERRMHLTTGYPVESTRDGVETDRQFYGFAFDFDKLLAGADLSLFFNEQQIASIDARRAVGAEIHYAGENGNITGVLDYDVDFAEINSILALAAWRLSTRTTVSGLVDVRLSPVLTTRNALIGQAATTIEDLLLVWTEEEIRQLAADRTARSRTVTLGLAQALGERFQINADLTMTEIEGTVASGGVAAVPGTGQQTILTTSLVGTGLFSTGDVNVVNLRQGKGDDYRTTYLSWDGRFPIGRRLRLNPRLRLAAREGLLDGMRRETARLALRLLFNTRNHYRFELELGAERSTRSGAGSTSKTSGYYLDLGYRANY